MTSAFSRTARGLVYSGLLVPSIVFAQAANENVNSGQPLVHQELGTHVAGPEDIEGIENLTLADFVTDFSKVKLPDHPGPMTPHELAEGVSSVLELCGVGGRHGGR